MPEQETTNTNEEQVETPASEEAEVTQEAVTEEAAPVEAPEVEETTEQAETQEEPSEQSSQEEIDINEYVRERYQAPPQQNNQDLVSQVSDELSQLPTDAQGNVESDAAAKWFAEKLSQAGSQAETRAVARAEQAVMDHLNEVNQQQKLLQKYPDLSKDKEALDATFDLRDAAAIRGENISLLDAAARLDKFRQQARSEGAKSATRTTTTRAAAHLETASTKGDAVAGAKQQLAVTAFQGSGPEAQTARRELLKQFVANEIKEGRIEQPR